MFSNCNSVLTIRNRVQFMIFIVIGWAYALLFAYFFMAVSVWLARRALIILFRNCNRTWNRIWMLHRCLWSLSWTTAVAFVLPLASQLWILIMICKVSGVFNLCWNTVVEFCWCHVRLLVPLFTHYNTNSGSTHAYYGWACALLSGFLLRLRMLD